MLDRITNLLVLLILGATAIIVATSSIKAWYTTNLWEEEWRKKADTKPVASAEELLRMLKEATKRAEQSDATDLMELLENGYERTGRVSVRFTQEELLDIAINAGLALAFLVVPISVNYVRQGRFQLWNAKRLNSKITSSAG